MAYSKLNLKDGDVLEAEHIGHIEGGIAAAHNQLSIAIYAVLTAKGMDDILANHTQDDIGSFYMYLGETTSSYKKGSVYQLGEV